MAIGERRFARELLPFVASGLVQVGGPAIAAQHQSGYDAPPPVGVALLVVGVAAIPFRLAYPVAALLTAGGVTLTYSSLDYAKGPMFVSVIVTFGNAVLSGHRRVAIVTLVAGYVGFLWLGPALGRGEPPGPRRRPRARGLPDGAVHGM